MLCCPVVLHCYFPSLGDSHIHVCMQPYRHIRPSREGWPMDSAGPAAPCLLCQGYGRVHCCSHSTVCWQKEQSSVSRSCEKSESRGDKLLWKPASCLNRCALICLEPKDLLITCGLRTEEKSHEEDRQLHQREQNRIPPGGILCDPCEAVRCFLQPCNAKCSHDGLSFPTHFISPKY